MRVEIFPGTSGDHLQFLFPKYSNFELNWFTLVTLNACVPRSYKQMLPAFSKFKSFKEYISDCVWLVKIEGPLWNSALDKLQGVRIFCATFFPSLVRS